MTLCFLLVVTMVRREVSYKAHSLDDCCSHYTNGEFMPKAFLAQEIPLESFSWNIHIRILLEH